MIEHKHKSEIDSLKLSNKSELEVIEDKIKQALAKKHEMILQLNEELRMKDMQIEKLKVMLDKQRRELLK